MLCILSNYYRKGTIPKVWGFGCGFRVQGGVGMLKFTVILPRRRIQSYSVKEHNLLLKWQLLIMQGLERFM